MLIASGITVESGRRPAWSAEPFMSVAGRDRPGNEVPRLSTSVSKSSEPLKSSFLQPGRLSACPTAPFVPRHLIISGRATLILLSYHHQFHGSMVCAAMGRSFSSESGAGAALRRSRCGSFPSYRADFSLRGMGPDSLSCRDRAVEFIRSKTPPANNFICAASSPTNTPKPTIISTSKLVDSEANTK